MMKCSAIANKSPPMTSITVLSSKIFFFSSGGYQIIGVWNFLGNLVSNFGSYVYLIVTNFTLV